MKRGNCFGSCPVYDLSVESDGKVVFQGNRFTQTVGKAEIQLSREKIKALVEEIKKSNFFSFKDDYGYDSKNCSQTFTDSSSVVLSVKIDEKEKTINHYHGCIVDGGWFGKENALKPLTNLENKIDEIVETKRWIGEQK